jgi:hypothetical protein
MTILELYKFLENEVLLGNGDFPIYFNTEARSFNYHMAKIGNAYFEIEPEKHVELVEDKS